MLMRNSLALLVFVGSAANTQSLTESGAVERGLLNEDVSQYFEALRAKNLSSLATVGHWDNPEVEFTRESLDSGNGTIDDDFLWIRQRINVAGVKRLQRESAASGMIAADASVDMLEREITADIRRLFYAALAAESERDARSERQGRLEVIAAAVGERVESGDASRYEQLRIERELALLKGALYSAEARAVAASDRLFARIGGAKEPLSGTLLPPPPGNTLPADVLADHPEVVRLAAEAESAELAAKAAGRERWPELTLGVGQRELRQSGAASDGNLVMLGIEVPLFDRGDGRRQVASNQHRALLAEYAIVANKLAAQLRATRIELQGSRDAALLLGSDTKAPELLADIAESAYDAGEIGIMELIDAHRADLQLLTQRISRAGQAREAFIQMQLLEGQ